MNFKNILLILISFSGLTYSMDVTKLKFSDHALERMIKRKIDKSQVKKTIKSGEVKKSSKAGCLVYCSSAKGELRVVVSHEENKIITVYYKNEDDMLSSKKRIKKQLKIEQEERIKEIEAELGVKFIEPSKVKDLKNLSGKELSIAVTEARDIKNNLQNLEE